MDNGYIFMWTMHISWKQICKQVVKKTENFTSQCIHSLGIATDNHLNLSRYFCTILSRMNLWTLQTSLKLLNITKLGMCLHPSHVSPGERASWKLSLDWLILACGRSKGSDLVPAVSFFALSHKCFNCPADAQSINYARILNESFQIAKVPKEGVRGYNFALSCNYTFCY